MIHAAIDSGETKADLILPKEGFPDTEEGKEIRDSTVSVIMSYLRDYGFTLDRIYTSDSNDDAIGVSVVWSLRSLDQDQYMTGRILEAVASIKEKT